MHRGKSFDYTLKEILYDDVYRKWCYSSGSVVLEFSKFKTKLQHFDRDIVWKRIRIPNNTKQPEAFTFTKNWMQKPADDDIALFEDEQDIDSWLV